MPEPELPPDLTSGPWLHIPETAWTELIQALTEARDDWGLLASECDIEGNRNAKAEGGVLAYNLVLDLLRDVTDPWWGTSWRSGRTPPPRCDTP